MDTFARRKYCDTARVVIQLSKKSLNYILFSPRSPPLRLRLQIADLPLILEQHPGDVRASRLQQFQRFAICNFM